jgi:hypothetical protein
MILPNKHVTLSTSLLNVGAVILNKLDRTKTVSILWSETKRLPEIHTFERFILGLDFLFMIGAIELHEGLIRRTH